MKGFTKVVKITGMGRGGVGSKRRASDDYTYTTQFTVE